MLHVTDQDPGCLHLPHGIVRFPIEWKPGAGFRAEDLSTWPEVDGRLEFAEGRLQYMPPCGGIQQDVASDVTAELHRWVREHPDFILGSNEAGMLLNGEVRAADAAIWRLNAGHPSGFRRIAPVLAVEVAGEEETEALLRDKASWYLAAGVSVVWLVLPASREILVVI